MKILVTGCLHGEWDLLCDTVEQYIAKGKQIDLIIVTGDAQTMRTEEDLKSFAVPPHFKQMGSFYKLYKGERKIPRPTIVVGGNHESSDFLHLLPFGGWLAPNIFYTGRASSLRIGNVTISAISGLYQSNFYFEKVNESYPIRSDNDLHKCFHIRSFSDFQLLGLDKTQIMISHDWPSGVPEKYGGSYLQTRKNTLIESDKKHTFGLNKGLMMVEKLKPQMWFASHHHIFFKTNIDGTTFYAFPKTTIKHWFDVFEIENNEPVYPIKYRGEWLSILKATYAEMENPNVLKNVNWDERWKSLKPKLEKIDDCPVGPFELNPYEYTTKFCIDHNIYCPNKEIREYMEKRKNDTSIIQQIGEEVQSLISSNANHDVQSFSSSNASHDVQSFSSSNASHDVQSFSSSNTNHDVQSLRDMLEAKNCEINQLRKENEKLKSSLNEVKEKLKSSLNVIEQLNDLNNKK